MSREARGDSPLHDRYQISTRSMCFMLHIATSCPVPRLAWNEDDRHVWVGDVEQHASSVSRHFSLPHIAYVGSDLNCGCGFRHVSFQNGEWPEESLIPEGGMNTEGTAKNHRELYSLLSGVLRRSAMVELYGCWADEYGERSEGSQEMRAHDILPDHFFFRERMLYRVTAQANEETEANRHTLCR
jgi:hypothetical protein